MKSVTYSGTIPIKTSLESCTEIYHLQQGTDEAFFALWFNVARKRNRYCVTYPATAENAKAIAECSFTIDPQYPDNKRLIR